MNELEIKILNFIKNRGSFKNPVPRRRLETEFGLKNETLNKLLNIYELYLSIQLLRAKRQDLAVITCQKMMKNETQD